MGSGVIVFEDGYILTNNHVLPGSPADGAGLREGDLIKEVDRNRVQSAEDFSRLVSPANSGDSLALSVRPRQNIEFAATFASCA